MVHIVVFFVTVAALSPLEIFTESQYHILAECNESLCAWTTLGNIANLFPKLKLCSPNSAYRQLNISRNSLMRILHKQLQRFLCLGLTILLQNHLFRRSGFSSRRLCSQAKLPHLAIGKAEKPHVIVERPMHNQRVTAWSGFWSWGIIIYGIVNNGNVCSFE